MSMSLKISVIIPAFNEEKLLGECLESLQKQTLAKDEYEVIVIDNGSTDKTSAIAKSMGVSVYYYIKERGPGAARAFGVTKAKGSILAFTDADTTVTPTWLETID